MSCRVAVVGGTSRRLSQTHLWRHLLASAGILGLLTFQAWAFYNRLPLSLGPRVILEPWLLRHGLVMYEEIADLHTPLMPSLLAMLWPLFPDGLSLAKATLVALLSLTTLLAGVVGWRKTGWLGGLGVACFVVLWSPAFIFGKLWHESFLAPLYLLLFLLFDNSADRPAAGTLLSLGLLGGLAILLKQHAALVFVAGGLWSALVHWSSHRSRATLVREVCLMTLPALATVAAYAVYQYARAGTLAGFWYWTVAYPLTSDYGALAVVRPSASQIGTLVSSCLLIPVAIFCAIRAKRRGDKTWLSLGLGLCMLGASAATIYPRFHFFHLQAFLPLLAVVSALTLGYALRTSGRGRLFAVGATVALSAYWLLTRAPVYRPSLQGGQSQWIYEYSDLVPLAQEVRQAIAPTDCLFIFPDDEASANLYYLTGCVPPRFWIFHYPWYMSQERLREKSLAAVEEERPAWVAYLPDRSEIDRAPELVAFLQDHYRQEATLDWAQGQVQLLKLVQQRQ